VRFTKMQGLGNDYVYIDLISEVDVAQVEAIGWSNLARRVSDRHFGVGGDGLIAILPGEQADFRMRMFNADGSEGEMCGNGIRCAGKLIHDHGLCESNHLQIETRAGVKRLDLMLKGDSVDSVRVDMGPPLLQRRQIPVSGEPETETVLDEELCVGEKQLRITAVSVGNPHCVTWVGDVRNAPVAEIGPLIENHALFPQRTNVEFAQVDSRDHIRMRVWERGSGETMACGTGACAATVAGVLTGKTDRNVTVELPGGTLFVQWDKTSNHIYMTGRAAEVYRGELSQEFLAAITKDNDFADAHGAIGRRHHG